MTPRPPVSADVELGLRNAGWTVIRGIDLARLVEVDEFSESLTAELDAFKSELFDLGNKLDDLRRKAINIVENLVELHSEPGEDR